MAKFSMGVSWEDAWECYQGTSVGLNLMTVTFGPFDLKAGEVVVVDPLITTDLGSSGDAHVAEGSPTTNYGSATNTQVQLYKDEYGTVYRNRIFIKFDLSPLPSNVYVTSANLYLYMYASTSHFRTLAAHEVSTSWNEAAITWNNKPSYDATATTTTGAGTSAGWRCFTITSDVESAIYSGSGLVSECIKDNSETSGVPTVPYHITKQFYSEEYGTPADRPYLQVTYGLKYALIVAGAWNSSSNEVDFWNDATFLYDTLVSNYGYTDGTIYFLYADGSAPSASNCYEYDDARTTDAVIDYANTDTTLRTVFSSLASIMNSSSQLLILCATHGGDNESYSWFNVWGAGTVTDDDFVDSNHLGAITSYNREIIVMQQCHSGGFIDEMSADNRIIMTACAENENASAYLGYNYGAFDYYWISAINGAEPEPYGDPVDADANDDGKVSIYEAYDYNTDYNPYRIWEHFQWDDTSVIGESTYP